MKNIVWAFFILLTGNSCLQKGAGSRQFAQSEDKKESIKRLPEFKDNLNYLQIREQMFTGNITIPVSSQEGIILKGKQVDHYIRNFGQEDIHCLVVRFPSTATNELMIVAARPQSNYNLNGVQSFFYYINVNDTGNRLFCKTPSMIHNLGTSELIFSLQDVCPDCRFSFLVSKEIFLTNSAGQKIPNIETNSFSLTINFNNDTENVSPFSCQSSSSCKARGLDCCSVNLCVKDKQLKQGTDTQSPEYLQATEDIQENPESIINYGQFFHLCPRTTVVAEQPVEEETNPGDVALELFNSLKELYECTTPTIGEMGFCTLTIPDALGTETYAVMTDDRSFTSTHTNSDIDQILSNNTIDKIVYAKETLYENKRTQIPGSVVLGTGNDSLVDGQTITLNHIPKKDIDKTLKIRYRIDASCEELGHSLGKCYKIYIQGQNESEITDHFPASNEFLLPFYADASRKIEVRVDDVLKLRGTHWELQTSPTLKAVFLGNGLQILDTQVVKITFFVDLNNYEVLESKTIALKEIKKKCQCEDTRCRLKPKIINKKIVNYICDYPPPRLPDTPLQITLLLSSKTVPHRYYDETGALQKTINTKTPPQEGRAFEYKNDDFLRPNNVDDYIGFNEIYGSLGPSAQAPKPAKEITVKKGKSYNIFVDDGAYSSCSSCGSDYYSRVLKLFPQSFLNKGGGYYPNNVNTDRFSRASTYRADDLLFGRACWVPATMIPWSHAPNEDRQLQRLKRLSAQHFLFANGYQRDWYGFDYGSVIGSFDGVTWFAIGNQRHIKAESSKLFLAVNAYFGDLTLPSSFRVVISENVPVFGVGSQINSNFESDGAECQKLHICRTDKDCITQLGWEYSCETVSGIKGYWPIFDEHALEKPDAGRARRFIKTLNVKKGGENRCVYRGRGAPCIIDYDIADGSNGFTGLTDYGLHACNANTYCRSFHNSDTFENKFNDRISRYARPVSDINTDPSNDISDLNTFGLDTKILGRPDQWMGDKAPPLRAYSNLNYNKVYALCLPGRDPSNPTVTIRDQHKTPPDIESQGDKVLGIGVTPVGQTGADHYLSNCSIYDSQGNYYHQKSGPSLLNRNITHIHQSISNVELARLAGSQAIPTNSLRALEVLTEEDLIANFETQQIEDPILQENRCLRAPGSSCFSDQDCAPSNFIVRKTRGIDHTDTTFWSVLNPYEIRFWQEELICSQEAAFDDEDYDLTNNKCCREVGKNISLPTLTDQSHHGTFNTSIPFFDNNKIPGLGPLTEGIDLNNPNRYSRNATIHDLKQHPNYPALSSARADACGALGCFTKAQLSLERQFNTFGKTLERTCCTGHWIRNFHKEANGGGHRWEPHKLQQNIPKSSFRCLNWLVCSHTYNTCGNTPFTCDHTEEADDPSCYAKNILPSEAEPILHFLGTLELLGIPQVQVKTGDWEELHCSVHPDNQAASGRLITIPNMITSNTAEYIDQSKRLFSANDPNNFHEDLKQVFSADETTCCLPAGTEMKKDDDPNTCCTGFINPVNNLCQLEDFTNLTVYFNRYVSSHAKNVSLAKIDPETGYINDPIYVERLACATNVCASGTLARGVVLSNLRIPGHENAETRILQWLNVNGKISEGLDELYNHGQRWNNHVYCVPVDSSVDTVIDCNDNE